MTDKEKFDEVLNRTGNYFTVKITSEVAKAYWNGLKYIDIKDFESICDKIISDRRPFKSQFPTITQFGPLHAACKPEGEGIEFKETDCDECHGEGLIYYKYWHFKMGQIYENLVGCGVCRNWRRWFSSLDPHNVFTGDGKFLYRHPGFEIRTKESLALRHGLIEIAEQGMYKMTKQEMSDQVMVLYGDREND